MNTRDIFIRLRNSSERKKNEPGIPQDHITLTHEMTLNQLIMIANYLLVEKIGYNSELLRKIAWITLQDQLVDPTFVLTVVDPFNYQQKLDVHLLTGHISNINLNTPLKSFYQSINYIIYDVRPYP